MNEENKIGRREAIKGMGRGLATLSVSSAFSAPELFNSAEHGLEDPRTKYSKPPFKKQSQPWPGLVSKMDPRPDHGEKKL